MDAASTASSRDGFFAWRFTFFWRRAAFASRSGLQFTDPFFKLGHTAGKPKQVVSAIARCCSTGTGPRRGSREGLWAGGMVRSILHHHGPFGKKPAHGFEQVQQLRLGLGTRAI